MADLQTSMVLTVHLFFRHPVADLQTEPGTIERPCILAVIGVVYQYRYHPVRDVTRGGIHL